LSSAGARVIPDRPARLKPCLRCGYSLLGIAGARNCPECGLAVRVSLSGNSRLEWSNPRWQRILAAAFAIMALGYVSNLLGEATFWLAYSFTAADWSIAEPTWRLADWIQTASFQFAPFFWALSFILLSKGEGRHPDRSRGARYVTFGVGTTLFVLASFLFNARYALLAFITPGTSFLIARILSGPWVPLVIAVVTCAYVTEISKRGDSRLLSKLSQFPLWIAPALLVFWYFNVDLLFWPLRPILRDGLFPLSMLPMLIVTTRLLLRGAREANANWVTDP
jgi:hypothetical protein